MVKSVLRKTLSAGLFLASSLISGSSEVNAAVVAPYFYTWGINNPVYKVQSLMDAKSKTGMNAATLAFVLSRGGCATTTDVENMQADINSFIASGGKVIVSFGGANAPYIEQGCTTSESLFNVLDAFVQRTGLYNLDFDVEGSMLEDNAINTRRTQALVMLRAKYPQLYISYTLPVHPPGNGSSGGLTQAGLNLIRMSANAGLAINVVNGMTMDYYQVFPGRTQGQLAIDAMEAVAAQLRQIYPTRSLTELRMMLGITPMIGVNDDNSVFRVSDAVAVANYAKSNGLPLVSWWSMQRDQVGSGDLAIYSGVNTVDFEFFNAFSAAAGPVPTPTPTPVPTPTPPPSGSCREFVDGGTYQAGEVVTYQGETYTALVTFTAYVGANWNPVAAPSLWRRGGTCTGTPTPSPSPTPPPGSGTGCYPAWSSTTIYANPGALVSYGNHNYTNKWWTRGDRPDLSGQWGVWRDLGICN